MSSSFRYQPFVVVSGNLAGKFPVVDDVLSSHEQEIYPTTSLDENCIHLEFQTEQIYYVDLRQTYLVLKLKLVRGRGYETYNTEEIKEEHKKEAKAEEEETAEEDAPGPLVTHVNNILQSIFPNFEVLINNQEKYNSNGLFAHKSYISSNSKEPFLNTRGFCIARVTAMEIFLTKLWNRLRLNLFPLGECKCLADPMASCCMVNSELTFSSLWTGFIQI